MLEPRVIPILLLANKGLVKGIRFRNHTYVGDPINVARIFSDKDVDELIFLDIRATAENRTISPALVEKIADECYMPFAVGGGIRDLETARQLLAAGAEKIVINSAAIQSPTLIREAADRFGSQSVVAAIDFHKTWFRRPRVVSRSATCTTRLDPVQWAKQLASLGAGEIMLTSVLNDGQMQGYDIPMLKAVTSAVPIPVIAAGGAGSFQHLLDAVESGGAAAAAAGSFFVFHGPKRAVLVNIPSQSELQQFHQLTLDTP